MLCIQLNLTEKFKRFVVDCFAIAGILLGLIITIKSFSMRGTLFGIHFIEEDTLKTHNVNLPVYIYRLEWIGTIGVIQIIFGILGLVAATSGQHLCMLIYLIYILTGTIITTAVAIYCSWLAFTDANGNPSSFENSEFRNRNKHHAIRFWNILKYFKDEDGESYTKRIEDSFGCCGWFNGLDYCELDHISTIMNEVIYNNNLDEYYNNDETLSVEAGVFTMNDYDSAVNEYLNYNSDLESNDYDDVRSSDADYGDYQYFRIDNDESNYSYYYYHPYLRQNVNLDEYRNRRATTDSVVDDRHTRKTECIEDYEAGNERCICAFMERKDIFY